MKKTLLSITCFVACILSLHAQILYSLTQFGGEAGWGTIGKFLPATNELTVVKSFVGGVPGFYPLGTPVKAANGKLYAMTYGGGSLGEGFIFSFAPSSSTYIKVHDFDITNGGGPEGSLMQANDGKLYGMTTGGGANGIGVIFSFAPSSSTYKKVHDFQNINGADPIGSLMQASDGKLYGMTYDGGAGGFGVIFSFDPSTSTYKKLWDFGNGADGRNPYGSLVQASDGKLYGMTYSGGGHSIGVIFSYDPLTSTYTKLLDFDGTNGANPYGTLIQASDGKLYGMTFYGGVQNGGVIFSFDITSSTIKNLKDFNCGDGWHPYGSLMQASDGKIYGMTTTGGKNDKGTIFSFNSLTSKFTKLIDYNGINGANPGFGNGFIEVAECTTTMAYYNDADGDGYGNPYSWKIARIQPAGYVTNNSDCDDNNKDLHPITYYRDADGDCLGDANVTITVCNLTAPAGYVKNNNDDDDHNKLRYKLSNYPNPFEGKSTIKYGLPFDSKVSIKVYDLSGRVVATLVDDNKKMGIYTVDFSASGTNKGFFYYKIIATSKDQHFEQTNKMIELR